MSKFYRREETEKEVKIVYTSLPIRMYLVWGLLLLMIVLGQLAKDDIFLLFLFPFLFFAVFLVSITFTVAYWKPMKETRGALKTGEVKISGSRWSFKNPRTVVIPKH